MDVVLMVTGNFLLAAVKVKLMVSWISIVMAKAEKSKSIEQILIT